jgi:hypothetical protein
MRLHRLLLLLVAMILAAGCGSSSGGGGGDAGADPAQAIPPGAVVYVEGAVRPEGEQGDNARALIEKFLPSGTTLESLIDDSLEDEGNSYAKDIKPWLGERVGIGVTDIVRPEFVAAIAVTDAGKAEDFLSKDGKKDGDYFRNDDTWAVVEGDYVLLSQSKQELAAGVKAAKGDALGDAGKFDDAVGELPGERLGYAYFDFGGLLKSVQGAPGADPATTAVLKQLYGENPPPVTAALTTEPDSATIESRLSASGFGKLALGLLGAGTSTELMSDAPADAFAAFGVADLGPSLKTLLETAAGAFGGAALTAQVESQTGINLQRDLFSWVGDVAVYAHGDSPATLNGAVVIGAKDDGAAAAALPKLAVAAKQNGAPVQNAKVAGADRAYQVAVPGAPGPVVIAHGNERVVLAFGEKEAADALKPSGDTLGDSGRYDDAKDAIDGITPALLVDLPKVLALAEALGAASDQDYVKAKPYLEQLDLLVTGSESDGDALRSLFTVTTK